MVDSIGNLPQGSYHVSNAYGGYIIFSEGITPTNPEVFLESVSLQARQRLRGGLRVSFHVDDITYPHGLQVEAMHTSFTQRLMYEEMNRLARTDSTFHPLINQVLQEAYLHQALLAGVLIEKSIKPITRYNFQNLAKVNSIVVAHNCN